MKNGLKKKCALLFSLLAFSLSLSAKETVDRLEWNDLVVVQEIIENANLGDEAQIKSQICISEKKSEKTIYTWPIYYGSADRMKLYRTPSESFLTFAEFSGGESGGSFSLEALYRTPQGIKEVKDESGYGGVDTAIGAIEATVSDLNGDGFDEVRSESDKFYGVSVKLKNKSESCSAYLTSYSYIGMSEIRLPIYKKLERKLDGRVHVEEITFSPPMRKNLEREVQNAEKKMRRLKKHLNTPDNVDLPALLQYLDYQTQLGKRSDALAYLKRMKFIIHYQCLENKSSSSENLHSFLQRELKIGDWETIEVERKKRDGF